MINNNISLFLKGKGQRDFQPPVFFSPYEPTNELKYFRFKLLSEILIKIEIFLSQWPWSVAQAGLYGEKKLEVENLVGLSLQQIKKKNYFYFTKLVIS